MVLDEVTYLHLGLDRHGGGGAIRDRPANSQPGGHRSRRTTELIDVAGHGHRDAQGQTRLRPWHQRDPRHRAPSAPWTCARDWTICRSPTWRRSLRSMPWPPTSCARPGRCTGSTMSPRIAVATTAAAEVEHPVGLVFAADHGVAAAAKVSALEPCATAAMFAAFAEGRSTIRSFARHAGATVEAVDVGIGKPTGDIRYEAAMSEERFAQIVDIAWTAVDALDGDLLVLGEMGIGNTDASAAVLRWPVGRRRRGSAGARASTTPR